MTERILASTEVIAYMKPGMAYHARRLADAFGVAASHMRTLLREAVNAGQIDCETRDGVNLYVLPRGRAPMPAMRKYRVSPEMRRAQERCKELYVHPSKFDR